MNSHTIDVFGVPICLPPDKDFAVAFSATVPALVPVVTGSKGHWDFLVDSNGREIEILCKALVWDDEESKGFYTACGSICARYAQIASEAYQYVPADVLEHPSWATPIMEGLIEELLSHAVDPDERRAKDCREMRREKRRNE